MKRFFGIYSKHRLNAEGVPLKGGCPKCAAQLNPHILQEYFYFLFIPLFPIQKLDEYFRCLDCNAVFNLGYKLHFLMNERIKERKMQDEDRTYARALIASMTHMAIIDKDFDPKEEDVIQNLIHNQFADREEELAAIQRFVSKFGNLDNYVFDLLEKVKRELSTEGLMTVLVKSVQVLLADGRIHPSERKLLKSYLRFCGLPPRMYRSILERAKRA